MNHNELLKTVHYDPLTGVFTSLKAAGNRAKGTQIGNLDKKGYMKALVLGEYVKLHRLAWFYVHGSWPDMQIDHINQIKHDNRITNLRNCGTSDNCLNQVSPRINNKVGYQGVHKIQKTGRYRACCNVQGKKIHLGVFATAEEASEAYQTFKNPLIPERI